MAPHFRIPSTCWSNEGPSAFFAASYRTNSRPLISPIKRYQIPWQHAQKRTQFGGYRRGGFSYQRFQQSTGLLRRWAKQPTFYYQVSGMAGACGGVYLYNLEEVPVSGRRRFNIISEDYEQSSGAELYSQIMQQYGNQILSSIHPQHRMVQRVLDRLVPHSGLSDEKNKWEVHVIKDEQKNAFVIPGGKVFVFSGILDVCQGDDGLAAVLGHEIAHNVAHHAAERMSSSVTLLPFAILTGLFLGVGDVLPRMAVDFAFMRPGSRSQESEADYIGLMMMAAACYDPKAAVGLWSRMEKMEEHAPPQYLSTHPSSHNRMEKISSWLPDAELKQEQAGCAMTGSYASDFRDTFNFKW